MRQELQADIHYYDRTDYERQLAGAGGPAPKGSRITSWLRGETMKQYEARLRSSGETVTARKVYLEKERVRRETTRRLLKHAQVAYSKLHDAMPEPVRTLMTPCSEGNTLAHMPHLGYVEVFQMNAVYPDGTRSRLKFISANFEATVVPGEDGLHFKSIPVQRDGVVNKDTFFIYGRRINKDGTAGELDPYFAKNGVAYRPNDLRAVADALFRVGRMTVLAQRRIARGGLVAASQPPASAEAPRPKERTPYDPSELIIPLGEEDDALPNFR